MTGAVPYLVGATLALAVGGMSTVVGFDRDRALYPTILIVVASYYALFAVVSESTDSLVVEGIVATAFLTMAIVGFRRSLWLVAAGLAAHGILDVFHQQIIANPGVPAWWPAWCFAYDVVAAGYLAFLLSRRVVRVRAADPE